MKSIEQLRLHSHCSFFFFLSFCLPSLSRHIVALNNNFFASYITPTALRFFKEFRTSEQLSSEQRSSSFFSLSFFFFFSFLFFFPCLFSPSIKTNEQSKRERSIALELARCGEMEQRADARFERNFYSFLSKRLCRAIRSTMNVRLRDNGRVQKSGRGKSFLLLLEETFESATRLNGRFFDSPISSSSSSFSTKSN